MSCFTLGDSAYEFSEHRGGCECRSTAAGSGPDNQDDGPDAFLGVDPLPDRFPVHAVPLMPWRGRVQSWPR